MNAPAQRHDASSIDLIDEPILLVGKDQTVSYANLAAHRLFGYNHGQLNGLSLKWLSPPSRHGELRNIDALFAGQTSRRIRSVALRVDGKSMDVTLALEPWSDANGQIVAVSIRYDAKPPQNSMVVPRMAPANTSVPPMRSIKPPAPPSAPAPTTTRPTVPDRPAPSSGARPLDTRATTPRVPAVSVPPRTPAVSVPPPPPPSAAPERSQKVRVPPHGPRSVHEGLAPAASGLITKPNPSAELRDRLDSALQLLSWLDGRFASENDPSLDDPRERQRLKVVLDDARAMVQECRREIDAAFPTIPKAPKLPKVR